MNFFNRFFSQRTMNVVGGTCICIILILTILGLLGLLEAALSDYFSPSRNNNWRSRVKGLYQKGNEIILSCDTIQGEIFRFRNQLIIPIIEIKQDSIGKYQSFLNFLSFTSKDSSPEFLFKENINAHKSKIVEINHHKLWIIEAEKHFYIFNENRKQPIRTELPPSFHLVFPETELSISDSDTIESDAYDEDKTIHIQENKAVITNTTCSSFCMIDHQLLIQAQSYNNHNNQYWLYDMDNDTIQAIEFKPDKKLIRRIRQ